VKKQCIENRTFDELSIGDAASLSRTLTWRDIELFAAMSGDVNPAHVDREFAKSDMFHKIIAHGMWGGALISTVLGTELPGPGTVYVSQSLQFRRPIGLGDTVTVKVQVISKDDAKRRITFDCTVTNQDGQTVISGMAQVIAPAEKVCRERIDPPVVEIHDTGSRS
jgi:acyl dehydratase